MTNECGMIQITTPDGEVKTVPVYGCGHCSDTVVMNPSRVRARLTCTKCKRWICGQKQLCMADCTPIYELAADHLEADPKWSRFVPALMAGLKTEGEARAAGLLI